MCGLFLGQILSAFILNVPIYCILHLNTHYIILLQ